MEVRLGRFFGIIGYGIQKTPKYSCKLNEVNNNVIWGYV